MFRNTVLVHLSCTVSFSGKTVFYVFPELPVLFILWLLSVCPRSLMYVHFKNSIGRADVSFFHLDALISSSSDFTVSVGHVTSIAAGVVCAGVSTEDVLFRVVMVLLCSRCILLSECYVLSALY